MVAEPRWYRQLRWSEPVTLNSLRIDDGAVPTEPGLYAFNIGRASLVPGRVRYIGEAGNLRKRLRSYTINYWTAKNIDRHKGRLFLFHADAANPYKLYVRWVIYGGHRNELEASLIAYLQPSYNTRDEEARHGMLDDRETLDPRFLMPAGRIRPR